jgi:hypothetical protein
MNGVKGDHPLSDILLHKIEVYGKEVDDLIRKIASMSSKQELQEWWEHEIGWSCDKTTILQKCRLRYEAFFDRAKKSGWEIDDYQRTGH